MYARVTIGQSQTGKTDEGIRLHRDSVVPACKKQKGFKGLTFLMNRNTNKGIVIGLWNTEADMTAGESSGFYKDQVAKVAPHLAGPPTMEHYEVGVKG